MLAQQSDITVIKNILHREAKVKKIWKKMCLLFVIVFVAAFMGREV
ncbi:unnamed protein product [Cuscuta europaea]|uniref:Uncharacterized protein n=1 Tax=Cuscuta europaea TaxID=41803 RepID=A0A9P1ENL6_CUSEU|nr:unnamed protein product [Cuscuta europaea]